MQRSLRRMRKGMRDAEVRRSTYVGKRNGDAFAGSVDMPDTNDPTARATHAFSARRIPAHPPGAPRRHDYVPTSYANEFSPHRAPVLTIWPKDSMHTRTLDSGGVDEHGVTRARLAIQPCAVRCAVSRKAESDGNCARLGNDANATVFADFGPD